ncbi:MAG: hypothetical protein IPM32_10895 [Ignavibacteriae bacterium]|nr:hypothetical protein [Ignavibacteriota bacterium]
MAETNKLKFAILGSGLFAPPLYSQKKDSINLMYHKRFESFGITHIRIIFKCIICNNIIESESFYIPIPNFISNFFSKTSSGYWTEVKCNCDEIYELRIGSDLKGGFIEIEGLLANDESVEIIKEVKASNNFYSEQIDSMLTSKNNYELFLNEITNVRNLNNVILEDVKLQKTLQRQMYSSTITCLEDYLSSTLVREVFRNETNFKNFVKTFHEIKNQKFLIGEIFEKYDQLKLIVTKHLLDVVYHNLDKVKGMYEDSLNINFPTISDLILAIEIRHDLVHRNGKNKSGETIQISKIDVDNLIKKVENFVYSIEQELKSKREFEE